MGKAFAALGIVLVASAVAAIVAATAVTNYVPEVYEHRARTGEVDWIITVESEVLRETRDLRVLLPEDYDTDVGRRYPVLLVLDGWNLDHTAQTASTLQWLGLGEPMIVVGVQNGVAGRGVDFVPPQLRSGIPPGRADRFLEFLEMEALPRIDRDLRTDSTRLIAGHSLGGLFVTYTLVQRPDLFTGRLAFSPSLWVGDQGMVAEMEIFLADPPELDSYFYTSLGSLESGGMHDGFNALAALLEEGAPAGLHWHAELLSGADHGNNNVRSTPSSLRGFWEYWGAH